ncbi:uncharacterized protein LOC113328320 isoform X2 [Papaver somniferum]|uniref:uncharacterized protein LOC113328320 isoform X2 n=1 Tax=Papaver somniferum TaxID=3469 RepID=UPI000E6FCE3D|nr:uncharacterized protein LOC113328320 isoform X2 [Papaver somniferum]
MANGKDLAEQLAIVLHVQEVIAKIAKAGVNDFFKKNFVKLSEDGFEQVLLTLDHRLFMTNCTSSIVNSSRSLFDRGKYKLKFDSKLRFPYCMGFEFLDKLFMEIIQKLVYQSGYQSNGFSGDSIACMLANDGFITIAWYMFDKKLECEVMRRLFDRRKQFEAISRLYFFILLTQFQFTSACDTSSSVLYTRLIFDRGRDFAGSFLIDRYTDEFVSNFVHWCQLEFLLVNSNVILVVKEVDCCYCRKLFMKMSQRGGITSHGYGRRLFDHGKDLDVLKSGNYIYKLILEFGYCLELLCMYPEVFFFVNQGDSCVTRKWCDKIFQQGKLAGSVEWRLSSGDLSDAAEVIFGESLNFYVGVHEHRHGSRTILPALKNIPQFLLQTILLTFIIVKRFVYPLRQNFPSHSHEIYNTLQDKEVSNQAIQYAAWVVFLSYTYFLASYSHWLGVHSGSECFGKIRVDRAAEDNVLMEVKHPNWSCLSTSDLEKYLNSCCNHVVGVITSHSTR